ncbi:MULTISPECIES: hypothetical protein [unclassified Virgibacillus]|nr:hypothetical protein [Virgibacillus sp. LDC-1]
MAEKDKGRVKPGEVSKENTTNTSKKDSRLEGRSGPNKNSK